MCVINIFSKYAWVIHLKNKIGATIVNVFQSILNGSTRKPNKIWIDKNSEFCSKYFKKWLYENGIIMHSTHNERKSVFAERFIKTFKNMIYKHMTAVSKKLYFDVLDDIIDECNNKHHNSIKIESMNGKSSSNTEYNVGSNAN